MEKEYWWLDKIDIKDWTLFKQADKKGNYYNDLTKERFQALKNIIKKLEKLK